MNQFVSAAQGRSDSTRLPRRRFLHRDFLGKSVVMALLLANTPLLHLSVLAREVEPSTDASPTTELTDITTLLPVAGRPVEESESPQPTEIYASDMAAQDSAGRLLDEQADPISIGQQLAPMGMLGNESDSELVSGDLGIRPVGMPTLHFKFTNSPLVASTNLQLSPEAFTPEFEYGYTPLDFDPKTDELIETAQLISQALEGNPDDDGEGALAEEGETEEELAARLARQSSNPLGGNFIILLNQIDRYFVQGDIVDGTINLTSWAIQPVISVPLRKQLGENWIWVTRPTFPIILNKDIPDTGAIRDAIGERIGGSQLPGGGGPTVDGAGGIPGGGLITKNQFGYGDTIVFSLLGQSIPTEAMGGGDIVWGLGPTFSFDTATQKFLGTGKHSIGPAGVFAFIGRKFILGALSQNWFSVGGQSDRDNVTFSWLNLFYFLNFPDGWQVGGTPVVTANWEADDKDRWTVPIALGVYKTLKLADQLPIKLGIEGQWMAVRPDTIGQQWNLRFVFAPILPSPFGEGPPPQPPAEEDAEAVES